MNELCAVLPAMTRFGVMKHLAVLESAGLVVTERVGREKRHFLNPVPIQQIADRWISKYAQPFTRAMTGLQRRPRTHRSTQHDRHSPRLRDLHQGPAGAVWEALTDPAFTVKYFHHTAFESTLGKGDGYRYVMSDGRPAIEGVDRRRRTVQASWR